MSNYDFTSSLSPLDFELLSKDLLEAELGIRLENFREGRDKGIDLRYAPIRASHVLARKHLPTPRDLIVQCKRYSAFDNLKSDLKRKELAKITALNPGRYILTTSVSLSPMQAEELQTILTPFVQTTGDIYGRERLNSLLAKHEEIERRHVKLWVTSAGVLDSILNAGTHAVSREEVERAIAAARIYVRNSSFDEALDILKKHHVCIISGIPGIGKTTLARMLLLYFYERKFDVVKIESDIAEARTAAYHSNPRFYYYDDFLGQTGQADKLNKNEDQKLLDFMASIRDSKQSVFVLTTREYILNQAKLHYEKLAREKLDYRTCVIDLSKYSRRIRAQILYNHLHFSDLPRKHVAKLVEKRGYVAIVDHDNYNPRLIEYLTNSAWVGDTSPAEYVALFLRNLNDPALIWDHAFRSQLSDAARHLLFVLTTMPTEALMPHVEHAFARFHRSQCEEHLTAHKTTDFRNALKELDGTFAATRRLQDFVLVRFQNPSIRDFMQNLLLAGELLQEVGENCVFFEQARWLCDSLRDNARGLALDTLARHRHSVLESMQRLSTTNSCTIQVEGYGTTQRVSIQEANQASRLAYIAASTTDTQELRDREFIESGLRDLTEELKSGQLQVPSCIVTIKPLRQLGYLLTEPGRLFVSALKARATDRPSELNDFETLARTIEVLPEYFDEAELQDIRDDYLLFVQQFAEEYQAGEFDVDDPEAIREDASIVENTSNLLGLDTTTEEEMIHSYADRKEEESETARDWESDDDDEGECWVSQDCDDQELDSMFATLRS